MKDNQNLLIGIIIAVVAFLLLGASGFGGRGYGMMWNLGYGFFGMGIFEFLFMIIMFVALVLFILWLIKQLQGGKR